MRVALEMRLTGGSDVLLAPQRGNDATAAIEVLTTLVTPAEDWQSFMQDVADLLEDDPVMRLGVVND